MLSRIEEIKVSEDEKIVVKGELLVSVRRINGGRVKISKGENDGEDSEVELSPGDFILFTSNENENFEVRLKKA